MPPHTVSDVLGLLGTVCNVTRQPYLVCEMILPDCPIAEAMSEEYSTSVIRDLVLYARIPPLHTHYPVDVTQEASSPPPPLLTTSERDHELVPAGSRERRISAFLVKYLEEFSQDLDADKTIAKHTVERVRVTLDFTTSALCFESLLVANGIMPNRRVVQAACKAISACLTIVTESRWTWNERLFILASLDPLFLSEPSWSEVEPWELILPAGPETGIRQDVLRRLSINSDTESRSKVHARQDIQKALFSNSDVQEVLPTLLDILRQTLQMVGTSVTPQRRESSTDQAKDGFEFRVSNETKNNFEQDARASGVLSRIVRTCVGCLATFPLLQSSSQDPIRDEDLFQLVIASEDDAFYFLADTYFRFVRRRILHMSPTNLKELMEKIGSLGETYSYSSWEGMRLLAVSGLRSTISIWASSSDDNLLEAAQELWHWLSHITLQRRHMLSWRVADAMTLLLDDYLQTEPSEISWPVDSETESQGEASDSDEGPGFSDEDSRHSPKSRKNSRKYKSPHGLLHRLSCDPDIRVRLRAVVASARSFNVAPVLRIEPKDWYNSIREELCKDPEDVEGITTRLICLGNIIIVNSPVRRGAYWHFLELCLHTSAFNRHIEAISRAVAERMGMTVASLFEAYASQIAWSIRETQQQDFLRLPFHLLGYRSMEECAQAAARAFSATNLLTTGKKGDSGVEQYGRRLFKNHCQVLKQDIAPMLREYVEEIVGRQIAYWIHSSLYPAAQEKPEPLVRKWDDLRVDDPELKSLESYLSSLFVEFGTHVPFTQHLRPYTDGVIASMIRTIGDQDFSAQGPVVGALEQMPGASAETFLALMRFRTKTYHEHEAALPAFDSIRTLSALKSLEWLNAMVPHADDVAVTYHVLHHLFAALECNPLVGKQLQLLNVIGIWISCRHEHFTDQSVMKTLLNGAVNILPQIDLAFGAQSMLDWAFAQLLLSTHNEDSATCLDTRLTEVLLRIGCVAFGFETQRTPEVSQGGSAILDWIESHIVDLYRVRRWRSQIIRALAAWPRELSEKLQSFSQKATLADLSQFLQDAPMSTNKFRVVRRLHQVAVSKSYEHEQFAKSDFWRLKACIPPEGLLSIDDVHSFAALLLSCRGHIDGLENENIITQSARTLHIRYSTEKSPEGGSNRVLAPRQAILVSLLHMLESASASQVYLAFRTLRSLASATSVDTVGSGAWPKGLAEELNLLKAYSGQTTSSSPSDLREMLRSEEAIQPDSDFAQWVTFIASTLCHPLSRIAPFYVPLISMVREDPSFAEEVLPVLVQTLLQLERSAPPQPDPHKAVLSEYFSRLLLSDSTPVSRRHVIVDTVLHLRHFRPAGINDPLGHDKWLDIDYTLLSRSAVLCGAYTTGLLFTELAAENDMDPAAHSRTTEQVLYEIYTHVDEPDGFYGIETDDLYAHLLKRLHHEHQWQKAFQFHGAALNTRQPVNVNAEGMLQSLHAFGFNNLAMTTLQALPELDDNLDLGPMTYNLGWRTETWDLPAQTPDGGGLSLYLALRAVHRERDDLVVSQVVHQSLLGEMGRLRSLGDENTTEIREVAQNLLCLNEIRSWQLSGVQDKLRRKHLDISSMTDLSQVDQNVEYPLFEALIATRISLLHSSRYKEEREQVGSIRHPFAQSLVDIETKCLVQLSEASRKARNNQVALNSIICAKQLCSDSRFDVSQEFAQTLWSSKEPRTAKLILEKLVSTVHAGSQMKEMPSKIELAGLYALLGTWASEACLDKADIIKSRYFDTAISLSLKEDGDLATQSAPMHARIFHRFASFAERQYNTLLKSPDAIRLKLLADSKKEEVKKREQAVARLEANSAARQRASRDLERAQKIMVLDENQIKEQNEMRDAFLEQAITMHSYALSASDEFDDDCAIRLCSLWLSNFDHPDNSLQTSIGSALRRVSSRKFVFLAHQLTARLAKVGDATRKGEALQQGNLQDVILRMCMEHPFHSMFPVFCLCPEPSSSSRRQSSNRHDHTPSQQARSDAASDISQRLRNDPSCKERVNAVIKVCEASLEWAKHPITQANRGERPRQIPEKMKILSVVDVKVPVLTAYTPIDPECSYENCVWIARFEKTYDTAGGVNLPKISKCIGSDGKKYKQLYKGQGADDLRQDAVMEQVFDLVNVVLRRDRETIRRNLRMRGYKVIPLAPQAGVIEFVGNTLPLNLWLSSMKSHERYRPQDIKPEAFARLMRSARPKKQEPLTAQEQAVLTDLFVDTRQNFKPVMRHFFTEQHKHPKSWFRMRLNYARSAAVTSIVGHVLGLGDRHLSNILIDTQSGELVHIDLGIAFEQGKLLPIPERVPFRLTADMVDGLGTTGVNGVFRKCGEETLRVLQSGAEVILTVLEVFKYDPLHSWVASDMKIRRMQPGTSDANSELAFEAFKLAVGLDVSTNTAGIAATRALNSVTRKLDKNLSVEETVDTLIAEATDVANLANMYIGWAPHL